MSIREIIIFCKFSLICANFLSVCVNYSCNFSTCYLQIIDFTIYLSKFKYLIFI